MDLQSFAFAFMAGFLSLLSPCGYPLLPGYISYYLGTRTSVGRALSSGLSCTIGIVTVFFLIGFLASSLGAILYNVIPFLDLAAGVIIILLGIMILTEVRLPHVSLPTKISRRKGLIGIYLFGVAYGLAGVGCSAPVFFSILFYAMASNLVNGIVTFVAYAAGMGLPLVVTSALVTSAKDMIVRRIEKATPWLHKVSGILLVITGLYLLNLHYSP